MVGTSANIQLTARDVERPNGPAIVRCRQINRVGSERCHIEIDDPCNGDGPFGGIVLDDEDRALIARLPKDKRYVSPPFAPEWNAPLDPAA